MASLNKILIIGNLVADPELKQTSNGIPVTSFKVAVSRKFAKAGEQAQADFFDVVCWRQQAEFVARFFTKGRPIFVCGAMQCRIWTDNNNQKRYSWEIVADEVSFVDKRADGGNAQYSAQPQQRDPYAQDAPANYSAPASNYGAPAASPFGQAAPTGSFEEISSDDELPF